MKIGMNLTKRDNGIYYVIFRTNGKQKWKSLGTKNKAEASQLYRQFKKAYLEGKIKLLQDDIKKITLRQFTTDYLELVENTKSSETHESYKSQLDKLILFLGGDTKINNINAKTIDEFIVHCRSIRKNKPVTVNKTLRTLRTAFNKAKEWKFIKDNPVKSSAFLPIDEELPRNISEEGLQSFFNVIDDDRFKRFFLLLLYTGRRRTELLNVAISDLDFDNRRYRVRKSKSRKEYWYPMSESAFDIFKSIPVEIGRLFPWSARWVTRRFKHYARLAGIGEHRLHDLRHTFGTILGNDVASERVLQKLMGHSNPTTTKKYINALDKTKYEAVNKIPKIKLK